MVLFVFFCILAIIALIIAGLTFPIAQDKEGKVVGFSIAGGVLIVSLVFLLFASIVSVGTKNLGVETAFGRPVGSLDNGLHWKAPWESVTELSDKVQTDTYATDPGGKQQQGAVATCINVRIARQATACVNVSIRWQIKETGVDYLFRNYQDNANITDNLVLRDLQTAMNENLVTYDPLGIDTNGNNTNLALSAASGNSVSAEVLKQMQSEIGTYIDVQAINIPLLQFDGATQDKINQLLQQIAATRVAQQAQQTATAQAAANQALAASVDNDPNVLVSKCLDILKEAVDKGMSPGAGFSCFGTVTPATVGAK